MELVKVFIPKRIFEEEEEVPKQPKSPIIENKDAILACKKLNQLLKREDIISNALPSKEEELLIVFIHGYGSSKWLWIDPYFGTMGWLRNYCENPKQRNYGWHSKPPPSHMYLPFSLSLSPLVFPEGLFNRFMRNNFEAITYTQKDPFGDIDNSAKEIEIILNGIKKVYGEKRIILVGHSRGGICIRRYLDLIKNPTIEKIITLGTPHKGTNLPVLNFLKQPLMKILNQESVRKFWDVTDSREVRDIKQEQLIHNSKYLLELTDKEKNPEIKYVTVAGSCSTFAHIYTWSLIKRKKPRLKTLLKIFDNEKDKKPKERNVDITYQWIAHPRKVLTIFEERILPEFKAGDGLVALESATLSNADRKYRLNVNHGELATCQQTEKILLKEIKLIQKGN